MKMEA
jgi:hypothetical protein